MSENESSAAAMEPAVAEARAVAEVPGVAGTPAAPAIDEERVRELRERSHAGFGGPVMETTGGVAVQSRDIRRSEENQARSAEVRETSETADIRRPEGDSRTVEEKAEATLASIKRHPKNREVLYDTLKFCADEHPYAEVEEYISAHPSYGVGSQSPHTLVSILVRAGGLDEFEYDAEGEEVTEERRQAMRDEGADEDAVEDLVAEVRVMASEAGFMALDQFDPLSRLHELLESGPERVEVYRALLARLDESSCRFEQVASAVREPLAAVPAVKGEFGMQRLQASYFIDSLAAADGIRWDVANGWGLTEAGRQLLGELEAERA